MRALRTPVRKELEALRAGGQVGSSLQAEAVLRAAPADHALLESLGEELKFVLLTSSVRLERGEAGAAFSVSVVPSTHAKCERCWHYRADVGAEAAQPGVCGRCVSNLQGPGESRGVA